MNRTDGFTARIAECKEEIREYISNILDLQNELIDLQAEYVNRRVIDLLQDHAEGNLFYTGDDGKLYVKPKEEEKKDDGE